VVGEGTWVMLRIVVRLVCLVGGVWWYSGIEGGLLWVMVFSRRRMGIDVGVAVQGVRSVGWILRLSNAERSGAGFWPNMLDEFLSILSLELDIDACKYEQTVSGKS